MQAPASAATYSPNSSSSAGAFENRSQRYERRSMKKQKVPETVTVPETVATVTVPETVATVTVPETVAQVPMSLRADSFANACTSSVRFRNSYVEFLSNIETSCSMMWAAHEVKCEAQRIRERAREELYLVECNTFAKIAEGTNAGNGVDDAAQNVVDASERKRQFQVEKSEADNANKLREVDIAYKEHALRILNAYLAVYTGAPRKYTRAVQNLQGEIEVLRGTPAKAVEDMQTGDAEFREAFLALANIIPDAKRVVLEESVRYIRASAGMRDAIATADEFADRANDAYYEVLCAHKAFKALAGIFEVVLTADAIFAKSQMMCV